MDTVPPAEVPVAAVPGPPLPPALNWRFDPWRQNPWRPAACLLVCLAVAALAGWSFSYPSGQHAAGYAGLSLLLLAGMTAPVWLPIRYRLDAQGVTVWLLGAPSFRAWRHYRNAYFHQHLVHLTTLPRPSGLDPFRGHALQFDPHDPQGQRAAVQPFIEAHLAPYRGKPAD